MHPESFPGGTHGHRARPERLSGSTLDRATRDARLADAAWHGGVGTAILSPDGRYLEVNPALCAFLERSANDLLQLRWQDLTPADTLPATQAAVDDLVRGDIAMLRTRKSWRTPDGRTVWGDLTSAAVRDADGAAAFLVAQVVDVTVEVAALAALSTSEERFRRIAENTAGVTFEADVHGRLTWISPSVRTLTGWHDDELVGTAGAGCIHPDDLAEFGAAQIALTCGDDARLIEFRFRCADGSYRWFSSEVRPLRNADGAVVGRVGTWRDTDAAHRADVARAEAESALRMSEAALGAILHNSPDSTLRFGTDLRVEFVNRRAAELAGIPAEEWVGKRLVELGFGPERLAAHETHLRAAMTSRLPLSYEFSVGTTEGERAYEARVAPVIDDDGVVLGAIESTRDVTERVSAERAAMQMATHDALTGLANRVEMFEDLARALAAGARSGLATAVLMLDLDRFKLVNDSLGHGVGDELIQAAAQRIAAHVRSEDLVARLGGDEFVVLMRDLESPGMALEVGWRIVESFRSPFLLGGRRLHASTSMGVAVSSAGAAPEALLREADTAMYVAKADGGDRLAVFNTDLRAAVLRRVELEADLRHAVETGELQVWFQPDVDLTTGAVVAAEALLRWPRADGSVWSAGRFIDVAEDSGLIVPIGVQVLEAACAAAAAWPWSSSGRPVEVRVNLSAHQVHDSGLLAQVDAAVARHGLVPGQLCVEITETVLLRPGATVTDNLTGLHARGIRIASDDFGTGYASLAQLREHPIDLVKIDRSFVADLVDREPDRRLVAGTIALVRSLGLDVTAEGVESAAQAEVLRSLGCPTAQGFLFGAAVPPDRFVEQLRR